MTLTILAFSMVVVFMYLIMTKRMSPLIALIVVPTTFGLLGGFARHQKILCRIKTRTAVCSGNKL